MVVDFVFKVECKEDRQSNVCSDEVMSILVVFDKNLEFVGDSQNDEEVEEELVCVGLENGFVGMGIEYLVEGYGFVEVDVGEEDDDLGNIVRNGGDVDKLGEDLGIGVGDVEEGKEIRGLGGEDSNLWYVLFVGFVEKFGGIVIEGYGVENMRVGVEE